MYIDKFQIEEMFRKIMEHLARIEEKLFAQMREVLPLDGDKQIDNQDMCLLLGITKRTLARFCQKKLIRYHTIRGKVWYKASEVAEFLKKKGKQ